MCDFFDDNDIDLTTGSDFDEYIDKVTYAIVSFVPSDDLKSQVWWRVWWRKRLLDVYEHSFYSELAPEKITDRQDVIFVEFGEEIVSERLRFWSNFLNIISAWSSGDICIIYKATDNLISWSITKDYFSSEEKKKDFEKCLNEFLEKLKASSPEPIDLNTLLNEVYHADKLFMRNIDSAIKIDQDTLDYANVLVSNSLKDENMEFPLADDPVFRMMPYPGLLPNIPILLKKEMPDFETLWHGIEDKRARAYIPKGKVLGYYSRDGKDLCKGPHIVLCPENIYEAADNSSVPPKVLFTKVLIHEIAHAAMDRYRIISDGNLECSNIKENRPNSLEAKTMEESLANAIAISSFEKYHPEDAYYVRNFIDNWQPTIYRFGIWQYKIDANWKKWRNSDKSMPKLKKWFDKCFIDGKIRANLKYTCDDFNEAFE